MYPSGDPPVLLLPLVGVKGPVLQILKAGSRGTFGRPTELCLGPGVMPRDEEDALMEHEQHPMSMGWGRFGAMIARVEIPFPHMKVVLPDQQLSELVSHAA